jgi:CrcB protein
MMTVAAFAALAALGVLARAMLSERLNTTFPWGTLLVNTSGSLALGALASIAPPVFTIVGTGGIGAYTTFSTFSLELVRLHRSGRTNLAVTYAGVSIAGCVTCAWIGLLVA